MTLTRSQAVAAAILVAQAVVAFMLTQPDVVFPPWFKLVLGCASVGLSTLALALKIQPAGPVVTVPGGGQPLTGGDKP